MKTLNQFEKQDEGGFDTFLKPMDRIDEALHDHIVCAWVAPNFSSNKFSQNGECNREEHGVRYYETVLHIDGKYYYLGEAPSMNPSTYI